MEVRSTWPSFSQKSMYNFWIPQNIIINSLLLTENFPGGSDGKESADPGSIPRLGRSPGEDDGYPLQYSCLKNFHRERSLVGYSPWGCKVTDTTEWLTLSHLCYIRILQYIFQSGKYCKTLNDQPGHLMYKNMNTEAREKFYPPKESKDQMQMRSVITNNIQNKYYRWTDYEKQQRKHFRSTLSSHT